jgi:uncharacterized protein (DUF3084 family)
MSSRASGDQVAYLKGLLDNRSYCGEVLSVCNSVCGGNDPAEFVDVVTRRSKRKTSNRLRTIRYTSPSNMTYISE